ncbi:MAG: hypothetical protein R3A80_05355 [Bdellovibrionota bacterium]
MTKCFKCQENLESYLVSKVSRQDTCPKCGQDIRCCKNCSFYEPNAHWECREEVSEHILDKEKSNFCDFYKLGATHTGASSKNKSDLMSAAEALFKKK